MDKYLKRPQKALIIKEKTNKPDSINIKNYN